MSRARMNLDNIFAGWPVVTGPEGVERIADAIDIMRKDFTENATPGLRFGKGVVCDQVQATGCIALQVDQQPVVARAIVGVEDVTSGT